jgi:hypothetical protein
VLQNLLTAPLLIKGNPKVWRAQKVATWFGRSQLDKQNKQTTFLKR